MCKGKLSSFKTTFFCSSEMQAVCIRLSNTQFPENFPLLCARFYTLWNVTLINSFCDCAHTKKMNRCVVAVCNMPASENRRPRFGFRCSFLKKPWRAPGPEDCEILKISERNQATLCFPSISGASNVARGGVSLLQLRWSSEVQTVKFLKLNIVVMTCFPL